MAKLRITIDVFSGRENPVIEVDGRDAQDALDRLRPPGRARPAAPGRIGAAALGYRGLIVEQTGARAGLPAVFRVAHGSVSGASIAGRASDASFEEYFFAQAGLLARSESGDRLARLLRDEFKRAADARSAVAKKIKPKRRYRPVATCRCAPLYEPDWWNVPAIQPSNNCYNYATNYRTNTFAQPGQAAGAMYGAFTCAAVRPAAIADELINRPKANNRCPREGHLVALVIWPGGDYHWYRKGRTGAWTHKPGPTAVTHLDNSGVPIPDPRTADRGPYTVFCTFMVVMHGHVRIS